MSISFDLTIDDTRDQLARHVRANMEQKPSLIGMSREEMADELIKIGVTPKQVKMRIAQLWHWLYVRGVSDFADMRNISRICALFWRSISPLRVRKWLKNKSRRTARASGCSVFHHAVPDAPSKSNASIFLRKVAARSAFPARLAARLPVPSATPARRSWCAISPQKKFWRS